MRETTRRRWSLWCNVAIVLLTAFAWCQMAFGWANSGVLSSYGLRSLRYFTIQSNLLSAVASLVWAVLLVRKRDEPLPNWAHTLRFVATTSVTLTLVTVELFLSPAFGYASMHAGANLWFHLLLPVTAIASFCAFEADRPIRLRRTLVAVVPMLLYGIGYYANILTNGVGEWPDTNDWYGFTQWGMERVSLVFLVMILVTLAIALVLRAVNQRVYASSGLAEG